MGTPVVQIASKLSPSKGDCENRPLWWHLMHRIERNGHCKQLPLSAIGTGVRHLKNASIEVDIDCGSINDGAKERAWSCDCTSEPMFKCPSVQRQSDQIIELSVGRLMRLACWRGTALLQWRPQPLVGSTLTTTATKTARQMEISISNRLNN